MKKFKTNLSPIEYGELSREIQKSLRKPMGDNKDYISLHYIQGTMSYLLSNNPENKDNQQGQIEEINEDHDPGIASAMYNTRKKINEIIRHLNKPSETTKEKPTLGNFIDFCEEIGVYGTPNYQAKIFKQFYDRFVV